jgi:hypothetical protein
LKPVVVVRVDVDHELVAIRLRGDADSGYILQIDGSLDVLLLEIVDI